MTIEDVTAYLEIYHHKMYSIWPVIDRAYLLDKFRRRPDDPETCALVYAVCAATGSQLKLDANNFDAGSTPESYNIIDRFAMETERNRLLLDYREHPTVACILIPFFLHMYYSARQKRFTATLLLREALTLCELLDLDKESAYTSLDPREVRYRRKVFWLLFITERGTAMQYDIATILRNTIDLPAVEGDPDPVQFAGFLSLVKLFRAVDGTLIGTGNDAPKRYTTEFFTQIQEELRDDLEIPLFCSETQKTDIRVTQQW